jgi:hypothetical protein
MPNTLNTIRKYLDVVEHSSGGCYGTIIVYQAPGGMMRVNKIAIGPGPNQRVAAVRLAANLIEEQFDQFDKKQTRRKRK